MIKKILGVIIFVCLSLSFSSSACVGGESHNYVIQGEYNLNQSSVINNDDLFTLKTNLNFLYNNSSDNYNGKFFYINYLQSSDGNSYKTFLYFWNNDKLYTAYGYRSTLDSSFSQFRQGYIEYGCFVDNLLNDSSTQKPCNVRSYNSNSSCTSNPVISISDFVGDSTYSNPDKLVFFNAGSSSSFSLCFIYNSLGKSVCFGLSSMPASSNTMFTAGNLVSGMYLSNFYNQDYITESPFGSPGGGGGTSWGSDIDLSCTKQSALNWYNKNGYTNYLCYGGYDDFVINDGTPLGYLPYWGTGLDFEEIWLETANLRQGGITGSATDLYPWFAYWRSMYDLYKRGGFDVNPFLNTPWVLFSYFGVIDMYGQTFLSKDIIEYCDLLLYTSDYSVGYSGSNVDKVCTRSNLLEDYNSNLSGDILNIGINTNGSGENITDGNDFINKYWALLKDNFSNAVENTDGVLPLYIQLALIGLILFRFISH